MADGPFAALYAMLDRDSECERDVLELVDEAASQLDKYREARDAIRDRCEQLLRAVHDAVADLDVGDEADAYTKLTDALNSAPALLTEPSTASTPCHYFSKKPSE